METDSSEWVRITGLKRDHQAEQNTAVIPKLGVRVPPGVRPGHLRVRQKKLNNDGKRQICQRVYLKLQQL